MSKKKPSVPPLPNNGVIQVHWGDGEQKKVMDYNLVSIHYTLDTKTGVGECTLNEPGRLNALTTNQIWEYKLLLDHTARDPQCKVLLWTGRGRAFSSGADLSGKAPKTTLPDEVQEFYGQQQGFWVGRQEPDKRDVALKCLTLAFWDFPKPSIVAVNGLAVGGAANIALANYHDLVLASSAAKFKYPFANLGLSPELGSSRMMPYNVGMTRAKYMMMLGEWFTAEEAKQSGLVLEVTTPDELMPRARALAKLLASKNQISVRGTKAIMNGHLRRDLPRVMDEENAMINQCLEGLMKMMAKSGKPMPKL